MARRLRPTGRPIWKNLLWLTGKFVLEDEGEDTDEWALAHNFVSVVPVKPDVTNYSLLSDLNYLEDA